MFIVIFIVFIGSCALLSISKILELFGALRVVMLGS